MQMDSLILRLKNLGLSEKQARVYIANLFLGPASAQKIAEQAAISRPSTYDVLEELVQRGLVSRSTDNGKSVFVTGGVEGIKDWLQRQADELRLRTRQFEDLVPELQKISRSDTVGTPGVRFVRGKEGVDAIWSYVIRKAAIGDEVLGITNHDRTLAVYPDHLKENPRVRLNKKLSSKQFYYNSKQEIVSDPAALKETKRLSVAPAGDITLYRDKAVLLSYGSTGNTSGADWTGVVIESEDIVSVLRQLFYLAWNNYKK